MRTMLASMVMGLVACGGAAEPEIDAIDAIDFEPAPPPPPAVTEEPEPEPAPFVVDDWALHELEIISRDGGDPVVVDPQGEEGLLSIDAQLDAELVFAFEPADIEARFEMRLAGPAIGLDGDKVLFEVDGTLDAFATDGSGEVREGDVTGELLCGRTNQGDDVLLCLGDLLGLIDAAGFEPIEAELEVAAALVRR